MPKIHPFEHQFGGYLCCLVFCWIIIILISSLSCAVNICNKVTYAKCQIVKGIVEFHLNRMQLKNRSWNSYGQSNTCCRPYIHTHQRPFEWPDQFQFSIWPYHRLFAIRAPTKAKRHAAHTHTPYITSIWASSVIWTATNKKGKINRKLLSIYFNFLLSKRTKKWSYGLNEGRNWYEN